MLLVPFHTRPVTAGRTCDGWTLSILVTCSNEETLMKGTDENLKAVVAILRAMEADGTMEQGQAQALARAIRILRKARRTHDPSKIWKAVDLVARLLLRNLDR
jgi:hypothetical protein